MDSVALSNPESNVVAEHPRLRSCSMPFLYLQRAQITLRHEPQSEISAVSGGGKTRGRTFPGRRLEFTTLGRSSRGWPARRGRRRVRRAGRRRGGMAAGVGVVVGVGCRRHPYASRPEPGAEPPATAGESASYWGAENAFTRSPTV